MNRRCRFTCARGACVLDAEHDGVHLSAIDGLTGRPREEEEWEEPEPLPEPDEPRAKKKK